MTRITVLSPRRAAAMTAAPGTGYAPRAPVEDGAVLTLIANGKPSARELLELFAEELRREMPIASVEVHEKASAGIPIDADLARRLAARSRLVITGLGD